MLTAGRLAGAVIFGLFGWYLAGLTVPFFPESNAPDYWLPASAAIGLFLGWRLCGAQAGRGYNPAIGTGLTTAFAFAFSLIFILAFSQMMNNAMRLRYDGPMEAVVDVFNLMLEFSPRFYDPTLIITLFAGGVVCAWMVEYFGQRYP